MDREDFMDIVYSELESDPDNNRANRIIWAADGYAERRVDDALQVIEEPQFVQLGTNLAEVGTDLISRQAAIDAVTDELDVIDHVPQWVFDRLEKRLKQLPPAQPEPCEDAVSRKSAIDGLNDAIHEHNITDFDAVATILALPPVMPKQPNLSEEYANAVFTWLMSYQIQSAQLKGRYTPYEVIGWVLNDWRKEHDAERDT